MEYKTIDLYKSFDIEMVATLIIYLYLFKGWGVTTIDGVITTDGSTSGWLAKTILNFYGIDTSNKVNNRGIFKNSSVKDTAKKLINNEDNSYVKVGMLLLNNYDQLNSFLIKNNISI